jgi:hypothetical protein
MNINKENLKEFQRLIRKYKRADGLNYIYIAFGLIPIFTIGIGLYNGYEALNNLTAIIISIITTTLFFFLFRKNDTVTPLKKLNEYNKENNDFKLFIEYIKTQRSLYTLEQNYLDTDDIGNIAISTNDLILSELHMYIYSR